MSFNQHSDALNDLCNFLKCCRNIKLYFLFFIDYLKSWSGFKLNIYYVQFNGTWKWCNFIIYITVPDLISPVQQLKKLKHREVNESSNRYNKTQRKKRRKHRIVTKVEICPFSRFFNVLKYFSSLFYRIDRIVSMN